jgi:hypothetical protein
VRIGMVALGRRVKMLESYALRALLEFGNQTTPQAARAKRERSWRALA